jgi:hypothetical protein
MKATLSFTLPEDNEEFKHAHSGSNYLRIIEEIQGYLRTKLKYESDKYTEDQIKVLEEVRSKLYEFINEYEAY